MIEKKKTAKVGHGLKEFLSLLHLSYFFNFVWSYLLFMNSIYYAKLVENKSSYLIKPGSTLSYFLLIQSNGAALSHLILIFLLIQSNEAVLSHLILLFVNSNIYKVLFMHNTNHIIYE
jgi:hypothetical protein